MHHNTTLNHRSSLASQDSVNCPIFQRVGACRHGDQCVFLHHTPPCSQTVLIPHMWTAPQVRLLCNINLLAAQSHFSRQKGGQPGSVQQRREGAARSLRRFLHGRVERCFEVSARVLLYDDGLPCSSNLFTEISKDFAMPLHRRARHFSHVQVRESRRVLRMLQHRRPFAGQRLHQVHRPAF
jgi:hypothetical protein